MNDRNRDPHFDSLLPKVPVDRRGFIVSSLATGFAVAAQPVMAQTMIVTDTQGLATGEAKVPVKDGSIPVYYARPATGDKFPVILVIPEIFGVHEHIKDVARRLAKRGYLAIAPEVYARQGDAVKAPNVQEAMKIANSKPDAELFADLDATLAWAGREGRGDTTRVGITGFCRGGRTVWMYSAHNPNLKAGVAWYGPVAGNQSALTPRNPIDVVGQINVPVLGLYGGADQGIPNDSVDSMYGALKAWASRARSSSTKACRTPSTPTTVRRYRKETAEDGWRRMLDWFKKHGL